MAGPDLAAFLSASRGNPRGLLHATRRVARHAYDLVTRRRGMQLVNGTALVGRLLRSALDLGVEVRVSSPVTELLRDDDGRVIGVVASTADGPLRLEDVAILERVAGRVVRVLGTLPLDRRGVHVEVRVEQVVQR